MTDHWQGVGQSDGGFVLSKASVNDQCKIK